MGQDNIEKIKMEVMLFEHRINEALRFKYTKYFKGYSPKFLEHHLRDSPLGRWDILSFINIYTYTENYPPGRLERCLFYLMDIKMQLYYLLEVALGSYKHMIYNRGYGQADLVNNPHIHLVNLAFDQTTIFMITLLWGRIFNFICYLEKEEKLEGSENKTKKFWDFVNESKKWNFMLEYKDTLEKYNDILRNPEVDKSSALRKEFLVQRRPDADYTTRLLNIAMNVFWDNLMNILRGEKASASFKDKFDA